MKRFLSIFVFLLSSVFSLSAQNTVTTVAGGAVSNNVAPTAAIVEGPYGVVRDAGGNLFIMADQGLIYKVTPGTVAPGVLTIYAGSISAGYSGDGGKASSALLAEPFMGALDSAGNLYFSDAANCVIREINATTQIITTVVGTGGCSYKGDGGPATAATLNNPQGIAFDGVGNLYIVDCLNNAIRRVDAKTKVITTYAGDGTGNSGYNDNVPANQALFNFPEAIASDATGNLYIADTSNNRIRYVNASTTIVSTVAGNGTSGFGGDGGLATQAFISFPQGVALGSDGTLYISDTSNQAVRTVNPTTQVIETIIGNPAEYGFSGDGGPATAAVFSNVFQLAIDTTGDVWVTDYWNDRIRYYDNNPNSPTYHTVQTVVGSGSVLDGGPATQASLYFPRAPKLDAAGNLYITDTNNSRIRKVDSGGNISTVAGIGYPCAHAVDVCGDGGPATSAAFFTPRGVAFDVNGNLLIMDTYDNRVRRVVNGTVTTIAGTGAANFTGDGGPAAQATFRKPWSAGVDAAGNIYVLDAFNNRVRKIDASTGNISTVAGSGATGCGNGGYSGDGGPATSATLNCPLGLDVDAAGNLFISDYYNFVIRRVDAKTQIITTIAGTPGTPGYTGDGGLATSATLSYADRVSVNAAGNLFISDTGNNVIRRVDAATGKIETFAGNGQFGFSGDGGPALQASFAQLTGVVVTNAGDLYVGDLFNNRVRKITLGAGATAAPATLAFGNQPLGVVSASQTATLTNTGDAPLAIASVSANGDFKIGTSTCGTTLAVGASCQVPLTFTPTAFGNRTGTLTFTDNGPVSGSTQVVSLTGTGVAMLTVTAAGTGTGTVTSSPAGINCGATCSADFTGGSAVTLSAAASAGSTFAGWSSAGCSGTGTCVVTLSANETVTATFNMTAVTFAPKSLTFASQTVNTSSAAQSITLTNSGTAALTISGISLTGTNPGDYSQTNTCPASLATNANCSISVTFKPTATGARTASVSIADNATGSPQTVGLAGTGTATTAPAVTFAPTSLTFASQTVNTSSAAQSITLTNSGNAALTISGVSITGANAGDFAQTNNCPASLAGNANCSISVTFKPTATGARAANVSVADNAPGSPQTVGLAGTGTATNAPVVTLAPTSLTFGSIVVGQSSAVQSVTLSNPGNATLTINSIGVTGANAADFAETTTCSETLAAGANCAISVSFKPTATGTRSASVSIVDNAANSPQSVALTGTGASSTPTVTITPASLTFASQTVSTTSAAQTVTVKNTGTSTVTFTSFSITGEESGDFALATGSCNPTGTLAAGASCTVGATFTPTATGTRTALLSIADNATGSPQNVSLTGTGSSAVVTITVPSGGSTTATSVPGGTAYYGLVITGAPGVTGTVTLGCTPSSPLLTCTVVPNTVVLNGGKTEVAFGIQTYCQGATNTGISIPFGGNGGAGRKLGAELTMMLFAALFGFAAWTSRKNHRVALAFATLLLVALGSAACGGGLAKGPSGATPAGTYTLTLTSSINGQTQTLPNFLTLIVQ